MVQLFARSGRTISARNVIIATVLVVATATLVLALLSGLGVINMCRAGRKGMRSGAGAKKKRAAAQTQSQGQGQSAQGQGQSAQGQGQGQGQSLIERDAAEALAAVRESGRDKIVFVLGQMSCPACQSCKRYMTENGYGDDAIFVDLMENGKMLQDGSIPKPVAKSLGRGVPCLVAYSYRAGAALRKHEGFSPKTVDELVTMVRS